MSEDWRDRAQCLGIDMQPDRASVPEVQALTLVCEGCPVRAECRALAEDQGLPYGVHDGEWLGDPPLSPEVVPCEWCSGPIETGVDGRRTRRFCSSRCRVRAHRAREESGQEPLSA